MKLAIIAFTKKGLLKGKTLRDSLGDGDISLYVKAKSLSGDEHFYPGDTKDLVGECFKGGVPLLFIGATGIAVRQIAPFLEDKLRDIPVVVMDEGGSFVIPILSGHVGGANELALLVAKSIGAVPVITTATDINEKFAADVFAKKNGFRIEAKEQIAEVSSRVLAGESISLVSQSGQRLMTLYPREYCIGIGCRRDTEPGALQEFVEENLENSGISMEDVFCIASVDVKKDEEALKVLSQTQRIPFFTYGADELKDLPGEFTRSEFVEKTIGVDNVCERAAIMACEHGGSLIMKKTARDGMTMAIARRNVRFDFE